MISPDYIVGFTEGEGCFGVAIEKENDKRPRKTERKNNLSKPSLGYKVKPSFRISLSRKDRQVLDEIQNFFGVGYVYDVKNPGGRSDMCQYVVQGVDDLVKLVDFFDQQKFHTTKGTSYTHWKEIVQMVSRKEHLTKEGILAICELREKMNLVYNKEARFRSKFFIQDAIATVKHTKAIKSN